MTTLAIAGCTKYINTTACEECSTFYGLKDNTCIDNSKTGSILYCKEY